MSDKQISRRDALLNTLLVGGGLIGASAVANAQTSSQSSVITVDSFSNLSSTTAQIGQIAITKCHSISGLGSLMFILKSGSTTNDGGTKINCSSGGYWEAVDTGNLTLYHFGGSFEGDCTAAMDAFLNSTVEKIKVPDNVTLGAHTFSATRKIINGGNGVKFQGIGAGFHPVNIEYFELNGFTNVSLSNDISQGHQFFSPAAYAQHGVVRITGNSVGGGIGGITASYESNPGVAGSNRSVRQIFILDNDFNDQVGEVGGTGYGIQYANENNFGECWIERNKIRRAGRHSYYIARNAGGSVRLNNNKAIDHRENSTSTRGNYRPAFEIARSQNVFGYGNEINGFYDGAVDIQDEPIAELINNASPILAHGIQLYGTKIKNPKNDLASIRLGGQVPSNNGLRNIKIIGIDFESSNMNCPIISYNYGHDLYVGNISARYKNIISGAIRPIVLNGNSTMDSANHVVDGLYVQAENCSGAILEAVRIQNGAASSQIPIKIQGVTIESDTPYTTFSSAIAISNQLIELMHGVKDDGLVFNNGIYLARTTFKSAGFNGRTSAASVLTPIGNFVPLFFGEEFYLSNPQAKSFWKANGLTSSDWVKLS